MQLEKPQLDDRPMWDVLFGMWGYTAILAAHQMKLFELLSSKPLTLEEVGAALKIERRPADALLALCASVGFLRLQNRRYELTPLSRQYLLPSSPTYFGWFFDVTAEVCAWSPQSICKAVQTNSPQGVFADPTGVFAAWHAERAVSLTQAMHSLSMGGALAWPKHVDLSKNRVMLDIGGGSAAHSIGAVTLTPNLRAVVLDMPPVCTVANEYAAKYELADRISTHGADFWEDAFPPADVHFYGMIFHDWPADKCRFLAKKSFESLPREGRIIVHEMLFNDDRTGPFPVAAFSLHMLMCMEGEQYSGREIAAMLAEAGFTQIEVKPTFGYWSIVTGVKP